ncbi:MAG: polysaccharide biosynthesis/export family protein [Luteimonas sp.]|nr:polysaccharide biosynthesis/export family protein [Luteimonas sp.]
MAVASAIARATSIEESNVKTTLRILALTGAVIVLGGCMPGQHLSTSNPPREDLIGSGKVQVVPITSELVATDRAAAGPARAQVPAELTGYRQESYQIQPGDTLLVTVWDHPELTTPAGTQQQAVANGRLVRPDGTFYFPYAGELNVTGMTIEQVRNTLAGKLARYLKDPQVDVNVAGYGSRVALQGAFTNTSPQEITSVPLSLSQAIGKAGINVEQADLAGFMLTRDGRSYPLDLDALNRDGAVAPEIYLKAGDQLFMPFNDRKEVYVIGEVVRPQSITFKTTDLTLTQALGRVGGLNPVTSKGSAVYVIRGVENMQQSPATVYQLDASSPVAFVLSDQFRLRPADVVFVGPAGITRWNRFLSQLLPLSGLISNAANASYDITRD